MAALVARVGDPAATPLARLRRRATGLAALVLAGALALLPWMGEAVWRGIHDWFATHDPWLASIE